ncbi:hypothetical protein DFS34DRAFT_718021 [Phlyctochytrium arcticum]|nr:hypothetical protein DFS34DRAFT_718021 [Phlyctochytrium arcticum]
MPAPSSTLASQLAKRAGAHAPGTAGGTSTKVRASLIFTPKQAADVSIDTLFDIGVAALADLSTHNPELGNFEQTLFSEFAKGLDRSLQTKEENDKLDESINKFLRVLSPYFLLQSTFKALEWLVRRFRINELNVSALLECILPYHETKQFVQVVSILALTGKWEFLKGVQKARLPLDRTSLVQRLTADPSILEFICNMVLATKEASIVNRSCWTFFALTLIQYVQSLTVVEDKHLRIVFSPLLSLLRVANPQFNDLLATAQMVFAQIANRAQLGQDVFDAVIDNAAAALTPSNAQASVTFLLTVYRAQKDQAGIPTRAFSRFLAVASIPQHLARLNTTYEANKLVKPMLISAVQVAALRSPLSADAVNAEARDKKVAQAMKLLTILLEEGELSEEVVALLAQKVFEAFLATPAESESRDIAVSSLKTLLQAAQRLYGAIVDKIVDETFKSDAVSARKEKQHALFDFITATFKGSSGQIIGNSSTTLYLGLQHIDANMRLLALESLQQLIKSKGAEKETQFAADVLLSRLADEDARIVKFVLNMPELITIVPHTQLAETLIPVLLDPKTIPESAGKTFDLCAKLLKSESIQDKTPLKTALLGCYLLSQSSRELALHAFSATKAESEFPLYSLVGKCHKLVKDLQDKKTGQSALTDIMKKAVDMLAVQFCYTYEQDPSVLDIYVLAAKNVKDALHHRTRILASLVLSRVIHQKVFPGKKLPLAHVLAQIAGPRLLESVNQQGNSSLNIDLNSEAGVPSVEVYKRVLKMTASNVETVEMAVHAFAIQSLLALPDLRPENSINWFTATKVDSHCKDTDALYASFILNIYPVLPSLTPEVFASAIGLLKSHFGLEGLFQLNASIYTRPDAFPTKLRLQCLANITTVWLDVLSRAKNPQKYDFQLLVPSLLIALADTDQTIRAAAITCLEAIYTNYVGAALKADTLGEKAKSRREVLKQPKAIFAYDAFYGATSDKLQYLTMESASALIRDVVETKKEITTDNTYLSRRIPDLLTDKSAKSGLKSDVAQFLLSNVLAFPTRHGQAALLHLLGGVDSQLLVKTLYPLLEQMTKSLLGKNGSEADKDWVKALVGTFSDRACVDVFNSKQVNYVNVFCQMLKGAKTGALNTNTVNDDLSIVVQLAAVDRINATWFTKINAERQSTIIGALVGLVYEASPEVVARTKEVLRTLPLNHQLLAAQLASCKTNLGGGGDVAQSKSKRVKQHHASGVGAASWTQAMHRLSALLELIESQAEISGKDKLIPVLFELLAVLVAAPARADVPATGSGVEYAQHLLLSVLLGAFSSTKLVSTSEKSAMTPPYVRVDILVQCMRLSDNPQTHNACLLLLAAIAKIYPQAVLVAIMPVFTLMGTNVMRQDDQYSFWVIQQTIKTIVPPLIASHAEKAVLSEASKNNGAVTPIHPDVQLLIAYFVEALFHIPKHRRLRLFTLLVQTLGSKIYLPAVILLLLAKHSAKGNLTVAAQAAQGDTVGEFAANLVAEFGVEVQVSGVVELIKCVSALPFESTAQTKVDGATRVGVLNVADLSSKELRQVKLATILFVNKVLGSRAFVSKVLALSESTADDTLEQDQLALIETILLCLSSTSGYLLSASQTENGPAAKYARILQSHLYDTLSLSNGLLALPSFLNVMGTLMKHDNPVIRRKAISLLDSKVAAIGDDVDDQAVSRFGELVEELRRVIEQPVDQKNAAEKTMNVLQVVETQQTALLCLTTLAHAFAERDADTYVAVLDTLVKPGVALDSTTHQLVASAMACVTALVTEVKSRVLPWLPKIVPTILEQLGGALNVEENASDNQKNAKKARKEEEDLSKGDSRRLVTLASLASLHLLAETVPQFLSPYVSKILGHALHPSLHVATTSATTIDPLARRAVEKASALLSILATSIPPRVLLPALFSHVSVILPSANRAPILALYDLTGQHITHLSRPDLTTHRLDLFKFFVVSLDYRRAYAASMPSSDVNAIETSILSAFLSMTIKLNATFFKPLFLKLVDWATSDLLIQHGLTAKAVEARQVTFYNLVDAVLGRLKSLATPYVVYTLDHAVKRLNLFAAEAAALVKAKKDELAEITVAQIRSGKIPVENDEEQYGLQPAYSVELWAAILKSLSHFFTYDTNGMMDADTFHKLLTPLVLQLDTPAVFTNRAAYIQAMSTHVVSSLSHLAVTSGKDSLWKPLNHALCNKLRSSRPETRQAALIVLKDVYVRLGEDMLVLFPETIPFLAEVMDDRDADVSGACREVLAVVQGYVGEDIQQYFTA